MRSLRRLGLVTIVAVAGTIMLAIPARAHALLDHSDPPAGAELATAPSQVLLTFTENPDPTLSIVHVLDANGQQVEVGPAQAVPGNPRQLRIALKPDLPDGTYTVTWRTVSEQDGHVTASAFAFGVGEKPTATTGSAAPTVSSPSPSPVSVVGKTLFYIGLSLLFAAGVVGLAAFGGRVPARRAVLLGGWLGAAVGVVMMVVAERAAVGVSLGDLLSSSAGHAYLWLLVAVGVAGVAVGIALLRPAAWSLLLVSSAASAAMLVRADGGHASASPVVPLVEVGLQWIHFMAAGLWIGGIGLASLLMIERRGRETPSIQVRRFSRIAGYALAAVVITGVLRALDERGGLSAIGRILTGSYGLTLLLKVSVVAALTALGAINRYRSIPRMERDGGGLLRRMMAAELVLAVGVFGLTGVLTGLAPRPPVPQKPSAPVHVTVSGSDFATTTNIQLTITPGTAGSNAFQALVTGYDSGKPLDASGVTLSFEPVSNASVGSSSLPMKDAGNGRWTATGTNISLAGVWNVTAVVQMGSSSASIPLTVVTPTPSASVSVATATGQPTLYTITFPGGDQLQAYNDPGKPGTNELHLTAFDANGNELPLKSATMVTVPPAGAAMSIPTRRFSAGHFVGDEQLTAGRWTFFLDAATRRGAILVASFQQSI